MLRLLYESSVSHQGHLLIPYVHSTIAEESIYSYKLLSAHGHKGELHKADNPAGLHSTQLNGILAIAKQHLDQHFKMNGSSVLDSLDPLRDPFRERYTYRNNLIIVYQEAGHCFYDHYPPQELNNIAAPKLFKTKADCVSWVKQGLDRNYAN